jgi:glycolate oxidase FAD binding subunit
MSSEHLSERRAPIAAGGSDKSRVVPTTIEELAAALRDTQTTAPAVAIAGAGTKATWGGLGVPPDVVVDMTGLDQIVEHAVGDLVITVEAGVRLSRLQESVRAVGQRLALDPAEPDATIGGVVATAASGPRRLRYGTPRDLLIGITVVLADGTVARSGGKVVKNVAGYDLGKLFTGSFGTLGVIASCTFRLHPLPLAQRVVSVSTPDPGPAVRALLRSPAQPSAIEWDGQALHVLIETTDAAADAQAAQVRAIVGGAIAGGLPPGFGARPWRDGDIGLKVTHRLSTLSPAVLALHAVLPGARVSAHAGSGVILAGWNGDPSCIDGLRDEIAAYDGTVVVVTAPDEAKRALDVWGPVPGLPVMRRIKQQFDPDGRMNRGRFVDGI